MSGDTSIEWAEKVWNPVAGCSLISPGCTHCYAMRFAGRRLDHLPAYKGLTQASKAGPVWTGEVRLIYRALGAPLGWRKPARIFVNSMSDLFHEHIPDWWIDAVFETMARCPQHRFLILTKRAERMQAYMQARYQMDGVPPHVWLGVSAEDQTRWDMRVPRLLETPAAARFVSAEPLLDWIIPYKNELAALDWLIVGGESGKGARLMHADWARLLRQMCAEVGTAFFFKQWGEHDSLGQRVGKAKSGRTLDGRLHDEMPKGA